MRMTRRILIALLAGYCFVAGPASGFESSVAESESAIRTWRKDDGYGLLADWVTAILQTRDGFLWVGTSGGLARFDGVAFTEVKLANPSANSPVWVTALSED